METFPFPALTVECPLLVVATPFPAEAELLPDVTALTSDGETTMKAKTGITTIKAMRVVQALLAVSILTEIGNGGSAFAGRAGRAVGGNGGNGANANARNG